MLIEIKVMITAFVVCAVCVMAGRSARSGSALDTFLMWGWLLSTVTMIASLLVSVWRA